MKHYTVRTIIAGLLAVILLLPMGTSVFAEKGPSEEHFEEHYYAKVDLAVLDDKGKPVMEKNGEWEENKTIPLYVNDKAVAQTGAVYDKKTNTLTLTDFKGNYLLRTNLMGDDFTVCVKGDCRLSGIVVYGGGVMQPKWGGSLHITGDGTLTVNENKLQESGILFYPQEEDAVKFTVDPQVTLNAYGSRTALEVYGYTGDFTMECGNEPIEVKKEAAVRNLSVRIEAYYNPWQDNIRLARNAADPEGIYDMSVWYEDDAMTVVSHVSVDRYVYIEKYDLYLIDYKWAREQSDRGDLEFATVKEANDAGFTQLYDDEGNDMWLAANSMGNHSSVEIYQDAKGNRYAVEDSYDDQKVYREIAMTIEPLEELPGEYLCLYAPDVDPGTLTQVYEDTVMEGMYDYTFPQTTLSLSGSVAADPLLGDVNMDGSITSADARLALRRSVNLEDYPEGSAEFIACDVNFDKQVTSADARLILRASVGLEDPKAWKAP